MSQPQNHEEPARLIDPNAFFIMVQIDFAVRYGLNEATFCGKLMRLMDEFEGIYDDDGNKWIRMNQNDWLKELPFFKDKTLYRTIKSVTDQKIVFTRLFKGWGRNKFYRFNPKFMATSQNDQLRQATTSQNDQLPPPITGQNDQSLPYLPPFLANQIGQNDQHPTVLPNKNQWEILKDLLKGQMTAGMFQEAFSVSELIAVHDTALTVRVTPNRLTWISKRLQTTVDRTASSLGYSVNFIA